MQPSTMSPRAFFIALALFIVALLAVSGCGGGGDSSAPAGPGAPAQPMLGPGASSISSTDGKVTVSVGDNALQAPVVLTIAPAEPDAETAADPSLVPGTTYVYTGPDIQVPEMVVIEIASPAALAADASVKSAVGSAVNAVVNAIARPLGLPAPYMPPPTCLVNQSGPIAAWQPVKNILVQGTECPTAPSPGCLKIHTFGINEQQQTLCAPMKDVIIVPAVDFIVCPAGYVEVTGEPYFADVAAEHGNGRICQRVTLGAPPRLVDTTRGTSVNCQVVASKFVCVASKLPNGKYAVLWDKTPPPDGYIDLANDSSGIGFSLEENGPPDMINVRLKATDPNALGGVELVEILPFVPTTLDAANGELPIAVRWRAPAAQFTASKVTAYDSQVFQIPYAYTDPAKRRFRIRVFDRAGNSNSKNSPEVLQGFFNRITIDSFTVTPSSVQHPGGPVTLSWVIKGAQAASIDNGVGAITVSPSTSIPSSGSAVVNVAAGTTFTLTATHPTRLTRTSAATVTIGADSTPPTVSLAASPLVVVAPGSTTLSATANDMAGVTKVEFYRGASLIATDTTVPYSHSVAFTPADTGVVPFTAKAFDAANNSATSAVVNVTVGADVTPPTVSLLANPATVLAPGSTTLQANVSDNIGVTKVEFYRGAALIATDTAAPYEHAVSFTLADLGNVSFTAKAFDAQNNNTTSAPAIVLVSTPAAGDTYASPTGVDLNNSSCSQAAPCLTIAKAAQLALANKTVWLMNGNYTAATQPAPIPIPAGLTLRALTPGLAGVGQQIVLQGDATVVGVRLTRIGFGEWGSIAASTGNVTLDGVKASGAAAGPSGFPAVLALSGTVHATMTPGNIADYADQLSPAGQAVAIYGALSGNARLTVNGGTFGGAALGGADSVNGAFNRGAFNLTGSSRLDLNNVVLNVDSSGIFLFGETTQLFVTSSTIHAAANTGQGYGIYAAKGTPQITLSGATISGFADPYTRNSDGIAVGTFAQPGVQATVTATGTSVIGNNIGVIVNDGGSSLSSLTLNGMGMIVNGNSHGGIVCRDACNVDLSLGEVDGNATSDPAANARSFHGGIWMGLATKSHVLKLRGTSVVDNKSTAGSNANSSSNSGVTMAGNAASSFDLGTVASPGNNVIQGNTSSPQTAGLNVEVAAGVTVSAVGNAFMPNVQGANAQGKYQLGTSPCGASSCNVTSGVGANYRVTSGTLRLAQ